MAFDEAKDLFPQRRKELLHWLKRQKVRDFGNLKRIYKQFFDDSSALDLELILLGQELDAKVNIIRDTKEEDAHSKVVFNENMMIYLLDFEEFDDRSKEKKC